MTGRTLTGRTALVTGANRGIGLAVAERLVADGHRVHMACREPEAAEATAQRLGPLARPVVMDVCQEASVAAARAITGPVDIVVNNAGVLLDAGSDPITTSLAAVRRTVEVNALGAWRVAQAYLPAMVDAGWGRLVMVSSGTALFSRGLHLSAPGYTLSKVALNALTVMLAEAVRGSGVLVNAINPGRVRTRMMPEAGTSPRDAAADVVWAATLPDDGPTGAFLRSGVVVPW
ncbi:MAG TPA: SDR family NAD(P)-dependent oxidoreductase [Streptosporangiaceae bacterium]|jgi:NAD(P)-dependent dehydrogenase (short-subunit alcohol dehydrogenase family)|nr:SDR family NAD(P)-dependent oxidoreductase [Streptosporangiaceae bacterium]